jgi:tetratricopeptide (TPR) repeat protein
MRFLLAAAVIVLTIAPIARAQEEVPEAARTLMEDAERSRDAGRIDDAVAKYRRAIEVAPSLASAYVNLGALYFKQGKVAEAYDTFVRGATAAPADRMLLSNAAAAAQQLGKPADALKYVDKAIAKTPRDAALYSLRATILRSLNRSDEDYAPRFAFSREGHTTYARKVVVPARSNAKSLADLRGKTISASEALGDDGISVTTRAADDLTAAANALYGRTPHSCRNRTRC